MSTIFPDGPPAFQGTGVPDSNLVILYNSNLMPEFSEAYQKMFESVVSPTGKRTWKFKGDHATFEVQIFMYKFDENGISIPPTIYDTSKTFANALLSYWHKDVTFYPFYNASDLKPLKNAAGNTITCHLVSIKPGRIDAPTWKLDQWILTFKTNEFHDLSKLVKA